MKKILTFKDLINPIFWWTSIVNSLFGRTLIILIILMLPATFSLHQIFHFSQIINYFVYPALFVFAPLYVIAALINNQANLELPLLYRLFGILVIILASDKAYKVGIVIDNEPASKTRTKKWLLLVLIWMVFGLMMSFFFRYLVSEYSVEGCSEAELG